MSIGVPVHLAPQVFNRAFSRSVHTAAYVFIAAGFVTLSSLQVADARATLWPAMLALVPMTAVLWLLDRHRTRLYAFAYVILGGASVYWFAMVLMSEYGTLTPPQGFLLALPKLALVLVGAPGVGITSAIVSCVGALIVAEGVALGAALQTGAVPQPDAVVIAVTLILCFILALAGVSRRTTRRVQPSIHRAAQDEQLAAMRYRIEVKAAAVMHDTVLNHLAAVAAAPDGPIKPQLRAEIQRDLEILIGEEWLADQTADATDRARTDWQQSELFAAIQESRRLGLDIDVSGDIAAVGRLARERSSALGLAVKQCLVNVLRHAGTNRAEVVVYGSAEEVSVMVIDTGRGFSEAETGSDRLGIRQSVRRRIEAVEGQVQLWSTPGKGTSVLISVPATRMPAGVNP